MTKFKNAALAALTATAVGIGGASVASAATLETTINPARGTAQTATSQELGKPTPPPRPGDRASTTKRDCPNDGPRRDGTGGPKKGNYVKNHPGYGRNHIHQPGKRGIHKGNKGKRSQAPQGTKKPGMKKPGTHMPKQNWMR